MNPCGSCPFAVRGEARERLMARMDEGAWIPCRLTAAAILPTMSLAEKIKAWSAERECVGAREWRRDRALPPERKRRAAPRRLGVHHICSHLRRQIVRVGVFEVSARSGIDAAPLYGILSGLSGRTSLETVATLANSVGLELIFRRAGED